MVCFSYCAYKTQSDLSSFKVYSKYNNPINTAQGVQLMHSIPQMNLKEPTL